MIKSRSCEEIRKDFIILTRTGNNTQMYKQLKKQQRNSRIGFYTLKTFSLLPYIVKDMFLQ